MRSPWSLLVLFLTVFSLALAACSTNRPNASAIRRSTSSMATTTTTSATVDSPCRNGQIAASIQDSFVGAGSAAEELWFRNVSGSACTLFGYPGVAALNTQRKQIAQAIRNHLEQTPATINLQPGQIAAASLQGSDGAVLNCTHFTRSFLVTPPNLTQSLKVTALDSSAPIGVSTACRIWISPVTSEPPQPTPAESSPWTAPTSSFPTTSTTSSFPSQPYFGKVPSNPAASLGSPIGAACTPGDLALTWGGAISEQTGQHTLGVDLTNTSEATCHLVGYPGISFVDATGSLLPLIYHRGGDAEVTSSLPQNVNLPARSTAYVLMNQYRCDLGDKQTATTLFLFPPNDMIALQLGFGSVHDDASIMHYCGLGDPGSIVDISPVEPTAGATEQSG